MIIVHQALPPALLTMVMDLHLTTTTRSSPDLVLKTRTSDKPSSEKWVLYCVKYNKWV